MKIYHWKSYIVGIVLPSAIPSFCTYLTKPPTKHHARHGDVSSLVEVGASEQLII